MPNLRIVADNAALTATLSASTTAGTLVVGNLLTDTKAEVWRSTGTSATLTLTWTTAQPVSAVVLPFCSLTSTATIRVRTYTNTADATPVVDSGTILACSASLGSTAWGSQLLGANYYAYGGYATTAVWTTLASVKKVVVDLVDTSNALGYIEAGKLVVGAYFSPTYNVPYGTKMDLVESTKHERSESGDLRTDRGTISKSLSIDLSYMSNTERDTLWRFVRSNGMFRPMFVSVAPGNTDAAEEQMFQIFGKLSRQSSMQYQFLNQFAMTLQLDEV